MPKAPDDLLEPRVVGPGFHQRVYAVVRLVPEGRLTTYGDVATILGSPRVARHVGWALSALRRERDADVPWQRVINARGSVSHRGDAWRADVQVRRLEAEGVRFDDRGRVIDFKTLRYRFEDLPPELLELE